MSLSWEPQIAFLPFRNPLRAILPKRHLSSKHIDLLNTFEETLTERLKNLKPADREDTLSLSWMKNATRSLCETHADINALIAALELPIRDWDEKWIDLYFDNSMKLLDACLAFTSEISRLRRAHLHIRCAVHDLRGASPENLTEARSSLDEWRHSTSAKNGKLHGCFLVMEGLAKAPKTKNFPKWKVLMRAMLGIKVLTLFVCSVFVAGFSGFSGEKLIDLRVPESCSWGGAFRKLQGFMNTEIRKGRPGGTFRGLKEVEEVYSVVNKLYPVVQEGSRECAEAEKTMEIIVYTLEESGERLYSGLNELAKEVDGFFKAILSGRDGLLCNLRFNGEEVPNEMPPPRVVALVS